jgi:hypothetical protein
MNLIKRSGAVPCEAFLKRRAVTLMLLPLVVITTGMPMLGGAQVPTNWFQGPTNWPVKGETVLYRNDTSLQLKGEVMMDVVTVATNSYKFIIIVREPETGYVRLSVQNSPTKNSFGPNFALLWTNTWQQGLWVVPGRGILEMRDTQFRIHGMKAASLEDARALLVAGITAGKTNELWPINDHGKDLELPLRRALGDDYILDPEDSGPRDGIYHLLSVAYTNSDWSIRLSSAMAKTNAVATVELDSEFNILKATRSDK